MKILFFDTETTGKAHMKAPPEADYQPRIVQLAALLCDEVGKEICSVDLIVKPIVDVPAEASNIHGITTEFARAYGVSLYAALHTFWNLVAQADLLVAHNIDFDLFVIDGETDRVDVEYVSNKPQFCTMKETTDICQIPGPYGFKWPRLQEAYKHAFEKEFDGAHAALADVRACKEIYFWIQKQKS